MVEITAKFWEMGLLVMHYAKDEDIKKVRYHDMQRDDIMEFMSISRCKTLNDMISRAREWEIDLENLRKRGPEQVQVVEGPGKRPKTSDQRMRGQHGRVSAARAGNYTMGFFVPGV